jgi:hypothetical protein
MIVFDETVVAGTVLFLIPFLKSTTLSSAAKEFSSTAGGVLPPRSSHYELPVGVGFAGQSCVAKHFRGSGALFRPLACRYRGQVLREPQQGRILVDGAPDICARAQGEVIRIAGLRSMLPDPRF